MKTRGGRLRARALFIEDSKSYLFQSQKREEIAMNVFSRWCKCVPDEDILELQEILEIDEDIRELYEDILELQEILEIDKDIWELDVDILELQEILELDEDIRELYEDILTDFHCYK